MHYSLKAEEKPHGQSFARGSWFCFRIHRIVCPKSIVLAGILVVKRRVPDIFSTIVQHGTQKTLSKSRNGFITTTTQLFSGNTLF